MKPDLFTNPPPTWREQTDLADKIVQAQRKAEKHQLVTLLCASLARMTEKPKYRRPL
jgi:hypothetical protein